MKVNGQLERASSQIKSFVMDESKSVLGPRVDNQASRSRFEVSTESRSKYDDSDTYRHSRSKENLLRLKQVFDGLDFQPV